jgi:hypothetical protein
MRKHAVRFLAFHAGTLMLLLLLGTVAHRSIHPRPAVILFEPTGRTPRFPATLPAYPGRAPQQLKRRLFRPPMMA